MSGKRSEEKRFVVDNMLGKVAKWLRLLGFNTRYERLCRQEQVDACTAEGFIVVTRNQRWCGKPHVICLTANDPMEQLRDVVSQIPLSPQDLCLLRRCIVCNELLRPLPKDDAFTTVPDYIYETQNAFYHCPKCGRAYWPGSHSKRITQRLHEVLGWSVEPKHLAEKQRKEGT